MDYGTIVCNDVVKTHDQYRCHVLQGKLSALLQCLGEIRRETSERQRLIKTLCVSAYPDLQPWQVKKACIGQTMKQDSRKSSVDEGLPELYYSYLSQLLDPIEGQEAARQNGKLVEVRTGNIGHTQSVFTASSFSPF